MRGTFLNAILLAGCVSAPTGKAEAPSGLDWLSGCWTFEDGSLREHWSSSEGGYLFGYAVTYSEGKVVFFEQMRIEPADPPIFNAYPAGKGPSAFPAIEVGAMSVTFANAEHDYPQRISYKREEGTLKATISLFDGSNARDFNFVACAKSN